MEPKPSKYPIFQALRSEQLRLLVRYGIVAGIATAWDSILFGQLYEVVFASEEFTKFLTYSSGVVLHFVLSRLFVFTGSTSSKARTQFIRFVLVAVVVLLANIFVIKGFLAWSADTSLAKWVGNRKLYNTLVSGAAAVVVGFGSFTLNRLYTFR